MISIYPKYNIPTYPYIHNPDFIYGIYYIFGYMIKIFNNILVYCYLPISYLSYLAFSNGWIEMENRVFFLNWKFLSYFKKVQLFIYFLIKFAIIKTHLFSFPLALYLTKIIQNPTSYASLYADLLDNMCWCYNSFEAFLILVCNFWLNILNNNKLYRNLGFASTWLYIPSYDSRWT